MRFATFSRGWPDGGYVERLPGGFSGERTTYAYRLTERGDEALADS
jgi:hypothetical protein